MTVPYTNQTAAVAGLLGIRAQGYRQSVNPISSMCQYRGPNGLKCYVGHLIHHLIIRTAAVQNADPELLARRKATDDAIEALIAELTAATVQA